MVAKKRRRTILSMHCRLVRGRVSVVYRVLSGLGACVPLQSNTLSVDMFTRDGRGGTLVCPQVPKHAGRFFRAPYSLCAACATRLLIVSYHAREHCIFPCLPCVLERITLLVQVERCGHFDFAARPRHQHSVWSKAPAHFIPHVYMLRHGCDGATCMVLWRDYHMPRRLTCLRSFFNRRQAERRCW